MAAKTLGDFIWRQTATDGLGQSSRTGTLVPDRQIETGNIEVVADPAFIILALMPKNVGLAGATLSKAEKDWFAD